MTRSKELVGHVTRIKYWLSRARRSIWINRRAVEKLNEAEKILDELFAIEIGKAMVNEI